MNAVFAYPETANDICTAGGVCKRKALDCATCESAIASLSELFADKVSWSLSMKNDFAKLL